MFDDDGNLIRTPYSGYNPTQSGLGGSLASIRTLGTKAPSSSGISPVVSNIINPNQTIADSNPMNAEVQKAFAKERSSVLGQETPPSFFDGLLGDKYKMGNLVGLAGTAMQAIALPGMLKNAKLQNKSLQFNLDTAKTEQARRNKNISSFNAPRPATSAFVA
jgi:hypothetical protein